MTPVLLYVAIYALALAPGLPLGFALFGRRHAAGWVAGAAFGYVLTALALWAPIRMGTPSLPSFVVSWLILSAIAWLPVRGMSAPLVALPFWGPRDMRALLSVLVLTLAIAVPPFMRAGVTDAAGSRLYRAYFTADFVWHTALTAELAKFSSPPRNPYLAPRPIHYYWTYFLLPSAAAGVTDSSHSQVETYLKVNAIGTALLFVSAIFICAWSALPRAWPVATGVTLAIVASSAEASFVIWRFWQRGVPLAEVRNLNIDAISNWWYHGLRIDGLQRCFWWVPQHSMAYTLGLVALTTINAAGSRAPSGAIALAGIALAGSTMLNPFVGGVFALVWGVAVVFDAAAARDLVRRSLRHALAIVPVACALAWVMGNRMAEGGGSALQFGWQGDARNAPLLTLMLSLGPALVAASLGLLPKGTPRPRAPMLLAALSIALMYLTRLNVDPAWIGFRAGQLFLVAVPVMIARGVAAEGRWRRGGLIAAGLALLAGAPTTLVDAYNAQDVTNMSESPIGPWTVTVTREEQEGLAWLRQMTPPTAVVQMEPMVRDRSGWSLIPSFAQRRMAAGQPISLLGGTSVGSEYADKARRVQGMYQTTDATQAVAAARALRIDYIWVDRTERKAYPAGVAKFDAQPGLFAPAFKNAEVSIYRVQ